MSLFFFVLFYLSIVRQVNPSKSTIQISSYSILFHKTVKRSYEKELWNKGAVPRPRALQCTFVNKGAMKTKRSYENKGDTIVKNLTKCRQKKRPYLLTRQGQSGNPKRSHENQFLFLFLMKSGTGSPIVLQRATQRPISQLNLSFPFGIANVDPLFFPKVPKLILHST